MDGGSKHCPPAVAAATLDHLFLLSLEAIPATFICYLVGGTVRAGSEVEEILTTYAAELLWARASWRAASLMLLLLVVVVLAGFPLV